MIVVDHSSSHMGAIKTSHPGNQDVHKLFFFVVFQISV